MGSLFCLPAPERESIIKHRPPKKVIFIGSVNVGKTSLLTRFARDSFIKDIPPTKGVDLVRVVSHPCCHLILPYYEETRIHIWDCCGNDRYWYLVPTFTRDARVVVAVYDVTSRASFDDALRRIESHAVLAHVGPSQTRYVLVGNKIDLEEREVERAVGEEMAGMMGYAFIETSAKSGVNARELFEIVGGTVAGREDEEGNRPLDYNNSSR